MSTMTYAAIPTGAAAAACPDGAPDMAEFERIIVQQLGKSYVEGHDTAHGDAVGQRYGIGAIVEPYTTPQELQTMARQIADQFRPMAARLCMAKLFCEHDAASGMWAVSVSMRAVA